MSVRAHYILAKIFVKSSLICHVSLESSHNVVELSPKLMFNNSTILFCSQYRHQACTKWLVLVDDTENVSNIIRSIKYWLFLSK